MRNKFVCKNVMPTGVKNIETKECMKQVVTIKTVLLFYVSEEVAMASSQMISEKVEHNGQSVSEEG